jgi:membrane-bound serine protease (ClpP class)
LRRQGSFACLLGLLGTAVCGASALLVDVDGIIHPITSEVVVRALEQARKADSPAVVIRLNTPGGLTDAARRIVEAIAASPVPVLTYVAPSGGRAGSLGFLVLEAGDVAAMAPGTNTGAARPFLIGTAADPVLKQKLESDAAAFLRSIAARRGRNPALAEKAVLENKSFTDKEALDGKLVDLVARDLAELLARVEGREVVRWDGTRQVLHTAGAAVMPYEKTLRQKVLSEITDPNLALILLVLGGLGIYVEFHSPGLIAPGIAGAILVLLGLAAISALPINWTGAALLLLALPFAIITALLVTLVVRARRSRVVTGSEGMAGETGVALSPIAEEGKVFVRGEYWDAVSAEPIAAGERIVVTGVKGLKLTVKRASARPGG